MPCVALRVAARVAQRHRVRRRTVRIWTCSAGGIWLSDRNGTILVAKERPTPPLYPRRLKNALVLYHIPSAVRLPKAT
jgi:hypothetical protein